MISDDERREIARRLRDSAEERIAVKGRGNGNNWSWLYRSIFGHHMGTQKGAKGRYVEVAHRLADLIEPDTTTDTTKCDRDALLEMADEMDEVAQRRRSMGYDGFAIGDEYMARRIRDALGVES